MLPKLFWPTGRKNCSSDLKFKAEVQEFAKFWDPRTIYSNCESSQNAILTCAWRFFISNKLEQIEFKLDKTLRFRKVQEELENIF